MADDKLLSRCEAKAIYQNLLDIIGQAIECADFDSYAPHFSLPHRMVAPENSVIIRDQNHLRTLFDGMIDTLRRQSVKGLTRACTIAEFVDAETIRGSHDTWLLNEAAQIKQSYVALSTLRLIDGHWMVSDSQYDSASAALPDEITRRLAQQGNAFSP